VAAPSTPSHHAQPEPAPANAARIGGVVSALGFILAISYPVLALSTGVRAAYQLLVRQDLEYRLPSYMSLLAATCYLIAAIGFAYRRRWTWWLSVLLLGFELAMVLLIGGLSLAYPDAIGRTVWRQFGADYGYFPLFQPLLGLIWLGWPDTRRAYNASGQAAPAADPTGGR
jgi:hypothetical protein